MSLQASDIADELVVPQDEEEVGLLTGRKGKDAPAVIKGSSWFSSAFLVVNAALGAGLLNFPQAYDQAGGVLIAIVIQTIMMTFVVMAIFILAYISDLNHSATYQDVVLSVCGRKAQIASAFALLIYCFGTCITFLIIIGDQWEEFFLFVAKNVYCDEQPIYMNRSFCVIVTSILLILPLCFPRRIDFLKYASFVGVVGIVYVVVMVTVKYFLPHDPPQRVKTTPDSWMDVFLVVPTICFAYQCHVSIIPIYSCMEKRNVKEFTKTISVAMFLCVISYTVTAALGYLQFGQSVTSDILLSFKPDIPVIIAVVFIAIKTYTTYPILLFCGRAAFESIWISARRMAPEDIAQGERMRRIITTVIWFGLTVVLAVLIPNIGVVIQMLGALAAVFIFIFPGMCLLKTSLNRLADSTSIEDQRKYKFFLYFSCFFIILGAFIFGLTLTQAILKDATPGGIKPDKSKFTC
ncbi:putative sodium-coupled neutral amino acid transporter 7 [Haliotis rufescens]|uniref:putative sodium-coupled neutral amino acid transporter 7 n=1 Tax=Haliotis rufescens TaxID=6454 RepID=UPI00201EBF37|nr:putative sodium-coupled neutral amino acid transporter 7 [Haliotis rufescens]